jgi:hypothetical protein
MKVLRCLALIVGASLLQFGFQDKELEDGFVKKLKDAGLRVG